ncbi:MAG: hypothetical protein ABIS36_06555 [Chryseolinea sp.]
MMIPIVLSFLMTVWNHESYPVEESFTIINDILYKISKDKLDSELAFTKVIDKHTYAFSALDSCYAEHIDHLRISGTDFQILRSHLNSFMVDIPPIFVHNGEFVPFEFFDMNDINKIEPIPKNIAIQKYRCKGVGPVFEITLKEGKEKKDAPVNGATLRKKTF